MYMKICQNLSGCLIKILNDQKCSCVLLCEWRIFEKYYYKLYFKCTLYFYGSIQ